MYVVFNGLFCGFFRGLEQRSHIHVEAEVCITGGNNFSSTVVSVLTHFSDHDTRTTSCHFCKLVSQLFCFLEVFVFLGNARIYSAHGSDNCFITSYNFFTCIRDFSQRSSLLGCVNCQFQQVTLAGFSTTGNGFQCSVNFSLVTVSFQFVQTTDLSLTYCRVVHFKNVDRIFFLQTIFVCTHDCLFATINTSLCTSGSFFDT